MALAAVAGTEVHIRISKLVHALSAIAKLIPFSSLFSPHSDSHPYFHNSR